MSGKTIVFLTRNGVADPGQEQKIADLEAAFADPDSKILLHLHGGLIDEQAGLEIAKRLSGTSGACWGVGEDWTQVYVVWRTGAIETIKTNWTDLAQNDRLYQAILKKLLGFVARKLALPAAGGRSVASEFNLSDEALYQFITGRPEQRNLLRDAEQPLEVSLPYGQRAALPPQADSDDLSIEFETELATDADFQEAIANIDGFANETVAGRSALPRGEREQGLKNLQRLDDRIIQGLGLSEQRQVPAGRGAVSLATFFLKHAGKIAWRCFERFRNRRDHGLHATVVEEICREMYGDLVGSTVWGMMVRDAAQHFGGGGFGKSLVDAMRGSDARFAISAHSAGSIWASHMLIELAKAGLSNKVDLYLLAPAVRHSLFSEALKRSQHLVRSCRMFTMDDASERRDAVLGHDRGYIYPSSLLYLVSGLFEERNVKAYADAPILGMQRFLNADWLEPAEQADAREIADFFDGNAHQILYAPKAGVTMSNTHGGFDDDLDTLASIRKLLIG